MGYSLPLHWKHVAQETDFLLRTLSNVKMPQLSGCSPRTPSAVPSWSLLIGNTGNNFVNVVPWLLWSTFHHPTLQHRRLHKCNLQTVCWGWVWTSVVPWNGHVYRCVNRSFGMWNILLWDQSHWKWRDGRGKSAYDVFHLFRSILALLGLGSHVERFVGSLKF